MIFLSLRFYVKSILGVLEVQNLPFQNIWRLWILTFVNFCTINKFKATKIVNMAVLELLDSPKLISRKIWMTQKSWYFHTVLMYQRVHLTIAIYTSITRDARTQKQFIAPDQINFQGCQLKKLKKGAKLAALQLLFFFFFTWECSYHFFLFDFFGNKACARTFILTKWKYE